MTAQTGSEDRPARPATGRRRKGNGHAVWIKRAFFLGLTGLGLYVVWPSLAAVFSSGPQLRHVHPLWGIPI